jgi:hypothetical protein
MSARLSVGWPGELRIGTPRELFDVRSDLP